MQTNFPIIYARIGKLDGEVNKAEPRTVSLPKDGSIRASVIRPILNYFAQEKSDLARLLRQSGLSPLVAEDPYAPIPLPAYLTLFEGAAAMTGDPLLGAKLGHAIHPADLGPLGMLVAQAGSVRRCINVFTRFTNALQTATAVSLLDSAETLLLAYRIEGAPLSLRRQDNEFTLACICGLIRSSFDARWRPLEVHFEHEANAQATALQRLFGAPIRFSQSVSRLLVNASDADLIRKSEDTALVELIETHLRDLLAHTGEPANLSEQVHTLIRLQMSVQRSNLETLAAGLGIPPRSLQRRLAAEGTSVRALLQQCRMQMAQTMLAEGQVSIEHVANALGYADGTAFWRAYKSWTGRAPSHRRYA